MSLEKAIKHGKEKRKPYQGVRRSSSFDHTCRNHGRCDWCKRNRTINLKRLSAKSRLEESDESSNNYNEYPQTAETD